MLRGHVASLGRGLVQEAGGAQNPQSFQLPAVQLAFRYSWAHVKTLQNRPSLQRQLPATSACLLGHSVDKA